MASRYHNRLVRRLVAFLEASVEKAHRNVNYERYWTRNGGPSRSARFEMRRPLLSSFLSAAMLGAFAVAGAIALPMMGSPAGLAVLPAIGGLIHLPRSWALQHHLAARFQAWSQRQHHDQYDTRSTTP